MQSGARRQYHVQQQGLKNNLEALFRLYRQRLAGDHAAALINFRRTGYTLLSEVDFFLFPPFFVASHSDALNDNNYLLMADIYNCANALIHHLSQDQLNQQNIELAKNALQNSITAINPNSGWERLAHALEAFCSALVLVAGIVLFVFALATPVGGIGAVIGLSLLGLFGVVVGGARAAYDIGHANNVLKKANDQFSSAAEAFTRTILPGPG